LSLIHTASPSTATELTKFSPNDVQPNAIDLRLKQVFEIGNDVFFIDETTKKHRQITEIQPDGNGYYRLKPGSYQITMLNEIRVGDSEAGFVITRSTLNRNGVFITSGLYDSGYHGVMAGVLHVTTGDIIIKVGTPVGQYLNFNSETIGSYNGSYGFASEHDKVYEGKKE